MAFGGLDHRQHGGEVHSPAAIDQVPAHSLARRQDVHPGQARIVLIDELVVLRRRNQVQPMALRVDVAGGFEPRHPEGAKQSRAASHQLRELEDSRTPMFPTAASESAT